MWCRATDDFYVAVRSWVVKCYVVLVRVATKMRTDQQD